VTFLAFIIAVCTVMINIVIGSGLDKIARAIQDSKQ
jgi:hypothetical protein